MLNAGYDDLIAAFPAFCHCPRDRFLHVIGEVCTSWSRRIGESMSSGAAPQRSGRRAPGMHRSGKRATPPAPAQSPCSPSLQASPSAAAAAAQSGAAWSDWGGADRGCAAWSDTEHTAHFMLASTSSEREGYSKPVTVKVCI